MNPKDLNRFSVVYFDDISGCPCYQCTGVRRLKPAKAVSAYAEMRDIILKDNDVKSRAIDDVYSREVSAAAAKREKDLVSLSNNTRDALKALELLKQFL